MEEEYCTRWGWFVSVRSLMEWCKKTEDEILDMNTRAALIELRMQREERLVLKDLKKQYERIHKKNS